MFPPLDWKDNLTKFIDLFAPKGLKFLHAGCGCGSGANENAMKAVFIRFMKTRYGNTDLENRESSCMINMAPGSPDLSILSFEKSFHGRTLGNLSLTRSKPIHKLDIPAFKFPVAPFPEIKYPLEDHVDENRKEEQRCLSKVRDILKMNPLCAGMIIEPI